jgi:hypothetical protein
MQAGELLMSRLFYEDEHYEFTVPANSLRMEQDAADKAKTYFEKVSKLIPSEVLAGYLTLLGLIPAVKPISVHGPLYLGIFSLCLILTPCYMNFQAEKDKPKAVHLTLSTIAFVVWAYVTSGDKIIGWLYDPAAASGLLVIFSLVSGLIPLRR